MTSLENELEVDMLKFCLKWVIILLFNPESRVYCKNNRIKKKKMLLF